MAPNRVLLVDLPLMLRELIAEAVASRSDIELVGELSAGDSVAEAIERCTANVVILPVDHPETRAEAKALLAKGRADVRIVVLDPELRQALVYDLQPRETQVGELSVQALMELIGDADRSS